MRAEVTSLSRLSRWRHKKPSGQYPSYPLQLSHRELSKKHPGRIATHFLIPALSRHSSPSLPSCHPLRSTQLDYLRFPHPIKHELSSNSRSTSWGSHHQRKWCVRLMALPSSPNVTDRVFLFQFGGLSHFRPSLEQPAPPASVFTRNSNAKPTIRP